MEHICGTSRIAGFRFSLYPMTDDFISVIKSALKKTDTSKVWTKTDHISTVLRGSCIRCCKSHLPSCSKQRTTHRHERHVFHWMPG